MSDIEEEKKEKARLASLHALQLLDSAPQATYDRITQLLMDLVDCDMGIISLLDEDRQWFLSKNGGSDVRQTAREDSFCQYAVESGEMFFVGDASRDERFADNWMVQLDPKIRFYMGEPIKGPDGHYIGALCAIGKTPKEYCEHSARTIKRLSRIVEDLIVSHSRAIEAEKLSRLVEKNSARLDYAGKIFTQAEESAKLGAWEINLEDGSFYASDGLRKMFEIQDGQIVTTQQALERFMRPDGPGVQEWLEWVIKTKEPFRLEADFVLPSGTVKHFVARGEYLPASSIAGARLSGITRDDTETFSTRRALQQAAEFDSLTGLYNRRSFDRVLGKRLAAHGRSDGEISLLLVDLDGFKDINDKFGHLAGDSVLEQISNRISTIAPNKAVVSRWGGDEFAIIAPPFSTPRQLEGLAEELLKEIRREVWVEDRQLAVGGTIGIAIADGQIDGRELMRRVDLALYHGKVHGPDRAHFYNEMMEAGHQERQRAIVEVRQALAEKRIFAAYQPIVRLSDDRIVGLETLMRLKTVDGEVLSAGRVLPAIQYPALAKQIGERMLSLIANDHIRVSGPGTLQGFVTLNVTEADLLGANFAANFLATLATTRIRPDQVALEITETMLMLNAQQKTAGVLNTLREAGVRIALDDFGTGFSSLSHLRDFRVDIVKIDGTFIQQMRHDRHAKLIVQALIRMAMALDIMVIAEGIETRAQQRLLIDMGCKYGQGYLFGAATRADDLAKTYGLGTYGLAENEPAK